MCFDPDARPPISGKLLPVDTKAFRLELAGGKSMAAFHADAVQPGVSKTGVILLPDNRGITPFYERLAEHIASEGYPTLAIDYFARDEVQSVAQPTAPNALLQRVADLTRDGCYAQMHAALGYLRKQSVERASHVIALGFCMGGRIAFLASQASFGLDGVIGLYGSTGPILDAPGPQQLVDRFRAPILGIFGGADPFIPAAQVSSFENALVGAGVSHEIVIYPGAPHSFFDVAYREHEEICADTWRRILSFLRAHSGT